LGLLLAGIPVLLHLLMRQKPRRLPFPAFRFLNISVRCSRKSSPTSWGSSNMVVPLPEHSLRAEPVPAVRVLMRIFSQKAGQKMPLTSNRVE
jgi:hypothetical protein